MKAIRAFVTEAWMFVSTQVIAIMVGIEMMKLGAREAVMIESTGEGVVIFAVAIFISTLMLILIIKFLNKRIFFQLIFAWLIFIGSVVVFEVIFGEPYAIILAIILVATRFLKPLIFIQNAAMILAIAGVAPQLAMFFGAKTILIILIVASVYDYIAVFKTKHMISMFEGLVKHRTPFSFVIPEKGSMTDQVKASLPKRDRKREYYLLGTGDVAFPAIFVIALLADFGPVSAILAMAGSVVGLFVDHYLLTTLEKPLPALPAIAFFSIIGFGISLVI